MIRLNKDEIAALKNLLRPDRLNRMANVDRKVLGQLYKKLIGTGKVELYIDGAADLHSKRAGIGGVFIKSGKELHSFSKYIGNATNNEAEYGALIEGLELAHEMNLVSIRIYSDSELIVKQIKGDYKVKNERMRMLHRWAIGLLNSMTDWSIQHIPRERNKRADRLSKSAMRKKTGS